MVHRVIPHTVLLAVVLWATQAASEAPMWPGTTPLRFEVTAAAGGLTDIVPRVLSNYLSASIAVPVVV
jgi:tripartite-type tricarboxylate transporter receptor subunit TctC